MANEVPSMQLTAWARAITAAAEPAVWRCPTPTTGNGRIDHLRPGRRGGLHQSAATRSAAKLRGRTGPGSASGRGVAGAASSDPAAAYYSLASSDYELEPGRIHLGYFGSSTPAGVPVTSSKPCGRYRAGAFDVMLHIFTNRPEETSQIVAEAGVADCVRVNPYVPYFEFLNLSTRLDWLLVTIQGQHLFGFNLPPVEIRRLSRIGKQDLGCGRARQLAQSRRGRCLHRIG